MIELTWAIHWLKQCNRPCDAICCRGCCGRRGTVESESSRSVTMRLAARCPHLSYDFKYYTDRYGKMAERLRRKSPMEIEIPNAN